RSAGPSARSAMAPHARYAGTRLDSGPPRAGTGRNRTPSFSTQAAAARAGPVPAEIAGNACAKSPRSGSAHAVATTLSGNVQPPNTPNVVAAVRTRTERG